MDIEKYGIGMGIGSLFTTVLGLLGITKLQNRMQTEIDSKVAIPTCDARFESIKSLQASMDKKLDILIEHSQQRRKGDRE